MEMVEPTEWEKAEQIAKKSLMGYEVSVHFTAKPAGENFMERLKQAGFPFGNVSDAEYNFYALSNVAYPFGAYVFGHIRPAKEEKFEVGLHLRRKGQGDVPKRIIESSRLLGGYPEVMQKFTAEWGNEDEVVMNSEELFLDLRERGGLRLASRKLSGALRRLKLKQETLDFKVTGAGCIKRLRVEFDPIDKGTLVTVGGSLKRPMTADIFDVVDNEMSKALKRLGL